MRRRPAIGAIVTSVLLLGACSSSSGSPAAPNARQYLLRISELPTGWTVDNAPQTRSGSCYYDPLTKVPSQSYAHVNFAQAGGLPQLAEEVAVFTSAPGAATGFTAVKGSLDNCKTFTETVNAETISGSLGPLPSPGYGDRSTAYDAMLSIQGRAITQGSVLVQRGRNLILVAFADSGALDSNTLQTFAHQATEKQPS